MIFGQSAVNGALSQIAACTWTDTNSGDYFGPQGLLEARGNLKK